MGFFYIVSNDGFLKKYYADSNNSKEELAPENVAFAATIRSAKMFSTLDDAVLTLRNQKLDKCIVIDQNGELQIF